jgi:hypothetical protein
MSDSQDLTPQDLTLIEGNDQTVAFTITPRTAGDDLTGVARVEVIFKPDSCTTDDSDYALVLTSSNAAQVTLLTQAADEITAEAYLPASYLAEPYDRVWRVDAVGVSGERRTAIHGSVTVIDT